MEKEIKMELKEISAKLKEKKLEMEQKYSINSLGIFGSYVRDEQRSGSDLDILVDFIETPGFFKFLELEEYLEQLLGVKVDLVSRDALKPRIGQFILKELIQI
jgi:predicted nucleotidyltransferase